MLPKDRGADGVWRLLEESYIEFANDRAKAKYRGLSDPNKRTTIIAFAHQQALTSKRWANIVQDLQADQLDGWKAFGPINPTDVSCDEPGHGVSFARLTRLLRTS